MTSVSTPSRICLFGEHQDYLGLDVIALAIDLRFSARIALRADSLIRIRIRDSKIAGLGQTHTDRDFQEYEIDLQQPITYRKERDYLRSAVQVLLREGYALTGADLVMDSQIPIGKGMCSSSTMIVALIKALLESSGHPDKDDPRRIAYLAFAAEVLEFSEPGGMMDHYASALGGLLHLRFEPDVEVFPVDYQAEGCFILFDSLQQKDTTAVLAASKIPTLEAVEQLRPYGVTSVRDFYSDPSKISLADRLDAFHRQKLLANIQNYRIFRQALDGLKNGIGPEALGALIWEHQANLRDGLGVSTPVIDRILDTAMEQGALGGKVNGSGGGGCCYAYARSEDAGRIIEAVQKLGYPAQLLHQDTGVRVD